MPTFIPNRLLGDLAAAYLGNTVVLDVHLLTAAPAESASTGANLTIASGGSYPSTPKTVTLRAPASEADGFKVVPGVTSVTWSALYTGAANAITHVGFTKRAGGSYASSDPFFTALEITKDVTIASVTTANGSDTITTTNSFASPTVLVQGYSVSGTGIAPRTRILEVVNSTTIRLTRSATEAGTITATFAIPDPFTPPTYSGGASDFAFTFPGGSVPELLEILGQDGTGTSASTTDYVVTNEGDYVTTNEGDRITPD